MKLLYNNENEKNKWDITKRFIEKHGDFDVVIEGFAGLGYLTSYYLQSCKTIIAIEKNLSTYNQFCEKYKDYMIPLKYPYIHAINTKCLDHLKRIDSNDKWVNVIDLDPWGASRKEIMESLRILKNGFLLLTNTGPYWINERNMKIKWLNIKPTKDWLNFPILIYESFVKPQANKLNKNTKLIDYYSGNRICRLIIKIENVRE